MPKTTTPAGAVAPEPEAARSRLLQAGLRLFAQQGFARTSIRELADAAQVNVAAIRYYFADKAGLYRAVFFEPLGNPHDDIARTNAEGLSLNAALRAFFVGLLAPLRQGDSARLCIKLRFREMLEPTGLWQEEVAQAIQPMHMALLGVLCRHFQCGPDDLELQRLAVAISGLGVHLHVGHDVTDAVAPRLNAGADALDLWTDRLVMYAQAMIDAELRRRQPEDLA